MAHQHDLDRLRAVLTGLEGSGYGAYKRLAGTTWALPHGTLTVERVQADPFAPPTRVRVDVPPVEAGFPADLLGMADRRRALADHLLRLAGGLLDRDDGFRLDRPGQEVLERSACRAGEGGVRLRLGVALPARGRRVLGRAAATLLCERLPAAVSACLRWQAIDAGAARRAVTTVEDTVALRGQLAGRGLVAFVADGAVLPRRSGVDDRPLEGQGMVPFASPPELRVTVALPHRGRVAGMGVPEGVTLVVGGGFHGKSTLLRALERGVYDHVPEDGRELVATRADAVKIRAEDGRRVERVDVSAFVGALPSGQDTTDFHTDNASGSTSQAASIVEAVEIGARVLLVDEDTSATNLMVRDQRMQELVAKEREPLTPFVDLARPLHRDRGVSSVLVIGGSGDYLDVADRVVAMDAYRPRDVTARARAVAAAHPGRRSEAAGFPPVPGRVADPTSVAVRRKGRVRARARGTRAVQVGDHDIDLTALEQLVDGAQAAGVAQLLARLVEAGHLDGTRPLAAALDRLEADLDAGLLDDLGPGDVARPRRHEVAAALNRLRSLRVVG